MSTDLATTLGTQLSAAAAAAVQSWGLTEALTLEDPTREAPELPANGQALLVEFAGRTAGELTIVIDDQVVAQLMDSPAKPPDLAAALGPAVTAACLAIGDVYPGRTQVLEHKFAVRRVLSVGESAAVSITQDGRPRAAVAIGIPQVAPAPPASRLDMLRGVEMAATAELGRARMTINDLLALRTGAVIELDRAAGAPADLYVNGRLIARGEVVVVDENYGLRIMQIVSDEAGR